MKSNCGVEVTPTEKLPKLNSSGSELKLNCGVEVTPTDVSRLELRFAKLVGIELRSMGYSDLRESGVAMLKLWKYQALEVKAALVSESHRLIEYPTGSGKTLILAVIASKLVDRGRRVLIAVTQEQIEEVFGRYSGAEVEVDSEVVRCCDFAKARDCGVSRDAVSAFLVGGSGVMLVTHSVLARMSGIELQLQSGVVLIVDEAHHAGETKTNLGRFVRKFVASGGRVIQATATAFLRSDGDAVLIDGMEISRRVLSQHMAEGFAPEEVVSDLVAYKVDRDVSDQEFFGDPVEDYGVEQRRELVERVVEHWMVLRHPKTVIRVPTMPSGARCTVKALCEAFKAKGASVLDASGSEDWDRRRVSEAMRQESELRWSDSAVDVVVGCVRVQEAMDWRHCSQFFCVGVPRSSLLVLQGLGRAMRRKDSSCPVGIRNKAGVSFFVPCQSGLSSVSDYHARHMLITCAMIEDEANARLWIAMNQHYRHVQQVPSRVRPYSRKPELELAFGAAVEAIVESGGSPTDEAVADYVVNSGVGVSEQEAMAFVDEAMLECGELVVNGLVELVAEFKKTTFVADRWVNSRLRHQAMRLDGRIIKKFGADMAKLSGPILPDMNALEVLTRASQRLRERRRGVKKGGGARKLQNA